MPRAKTTITVICGQRRTTLLWCDAQGRAFDSLNSPADLATVGLNLAAWKGFLIIVQGIDDSAITSLAAHLRAQGHTVSSPEPARQEVAA